MEEGKAVVELVAGVVTLLAIAGAVRAVTDRLKLPYTVVLVLVGIVLGELVLYWEPLADFQNFSVSPAVILFVLLPTLLFESAFEMDSRQLRANLLPVLTLAVPGLLISTGIIGVIVWLATPFDLVPSLLLGSILSATDPVAVVAIFRKLGAPARLTALVDGESLLNDATAIVVARILVGVLAAGYFDAATAIEGIVDFFVVFVGGGIVGWLLALFVGWLIGKIEDDPFVETSLTTILAYFSFLVAEEVFHMSGVMAVVLAGITMGGWGRAKISALGEEYLEHFWHFAGSLANALLFLLVGLRVQPVMLLENLNILLWVILAMLVSRAVGVFGLVPLVGRLPGSRPVPLAYRAVMYWGGLRGAIAIAIVLGLEAYEFADAFIAVVIGAVLFTLLVQGLTIEALVRWLKLDQPPLADRVGRREGQLAALRHAKERIPELQEGGLFSQRIAADVHGHLSADAAKLRSELDALRATELTGDQELRILLSRCFASEKTLYHDMFLKGHLSERSYRDLHESVTLQVDAIRNDTPLPTRTLHAPGERGLGRALQTALDGLGLAGWAEHRRKARIARDYEDAWGRFQGSSQILEHLAETALAVSTPDDVVARARAMYDEWKSAARARIDQAAEQFPEFVNAMQDRLARRMVANAQSEVIREAVEAGAMPPGIAEQLVRDLSGAARALRGGVIAPLHFDAAELLRNVPLFQPIPENEFARIAAVVVHRAVPQGDAIVAQGEKGTSLFMIARGVVRVSARQAGEEHDIATLVAGDFFGEMAVLSDERRAATVRAVTACVVFELRRADFEAVAAASPAIRAGLAEAVRARREASTEPDGGPAA